MTDSNLTLEALQKPRSKTKRRMLTVLLCTTLVGTPLLVAGNANALSIASFLQYLQQAQQLISKIQNGGLGNLSAGTLTNYLSLFSQVPNQELQTQLSRILSNPNLDPQTLKLVQSISSTLGQLGVPIPSQVNQVAQTISSATAPASEPFGLTQNQNLLGGLQISSDTVAASVLGSQGQQDISSILTDSQTAWQNAGDMMQTNGAGILSDSVNTATNAQLAFDSQDVLKAIAVQNTQNSAMTQQVGASQAEIGKISAMGVNLQAKNLLVNAQGLQVQEFQAEKMAAADGARSADIQGAFGATQINAMMAACLSAVDCKSGN